MFIVLIGDCCCSIMIVMNLLLLFTREFLQTLTSPNPESVVIRLACSLLWWLVQEKQKREEPQRKSMTHMVLLLLGRLRESCQRRRVVRFFWVSLDNSIPLIFGYSFYVWYRFCWRVLLWWVTCWISVFSFLSLKFYIHRNHANAFWYIS